MLAARLMTALNSHRNSSRAATLLRKLYLALVSGTPAADSGTINVPIGRAQHTGLCSGLFVADVAPGKPAKSIWSVVRRLPQQDASVLAVVIFSGVFVTDCREFLKGASGLMSMDSATK